MQCAAFAGLREKYPRTGSFAASEGITAAALAEQCLKTGTEPIEFQGQAIEGCLVDQEMVRYITRYVHHFRARMEASQSHGIEDKHRHEFANGAILSVVPDFWAFDGAENCLEVADLKYGRGWVLPYENWQMIGAAVVMFWEGNGWMPAKVKLTIHQPRASHPLGPVRSWTFDGQLLRNYANMISMAVEASMVPEPIMTPGPECLYCPVATECDANKGLVSAFIDWATKSTTRPPTARSVGKELSSIEVAEKMLRSRKVALEETALGMLKKGEIIPGYESQQSMGNLSWKGDGIKIGDGLGVDLRKPALPMTPTQAIEAGLLTEDKAKYFTERKPLGFKLKQIDLQRVRSIING